MAGLHFVRSGWTDPRANALARRFNASRIRGWCARSRRRRHAVPDRCQLLRIEIIRAVVSTGGRRPGHLVVRRWVRHVTRLDRALRRRVLCERWRRDERKSRETNYELVARHLAVPFLLTSNSHFGLLAA